MSDPRHESAVNPLPPVVMVLTLAIVVVEAAFSMGAQGFIGGPDAVGWRLSALQNFSFSGEIVMWMLDTGRWPLDQLVRFLSYPFVHASFTHAIFAAVMLLALGKIVAETLGAAATLAVFVLSGIGGALAYAALPDVSMPLIGAFPPIYGLIGAFTYLLWVRLGQVGVQQVRAFTLIGILLAIQLIFGVLFGGSPDWVADIAGFVTGFALATVFIPGGLARLIGLIRRD